MNSIDTTDTARNVSEQRTRTTHSALLKRTAAVLAFLFFAAIAVGPAQADILEDASGSSVSLAETPLLPLPLPVAVEIPVPVESPRYTPDVAEIVLGGFEGIEPLPEGPGCKNWLANVLYETGFRDENLREAWSIVMRESGGREDAISSTGDYGMFQFNRAAWSSQEWWDTNRLLTREYNAKVAYKISEGGKTWYPWDINGQGEHLGRYTSSGTYSVYQKWYKKFPC